MTVNKCAKLFLNFNQQRSYSPDKISDGRTHSQTETLTHTHTLDSHWDTYFSQPSQRARQKWIICSLRANVPFSTMFEVVWYSGIKTCMHGVVVSHCLHHEWRCQHDITSLYRNILWTFVVFRYNYRHSLKFIKTRRGSFLSMLEKIGLINSILNDHSWNIVL